MGKVVFAGGKVGMTAPTPLPAGYSRLEYIQSSGTQHINTAFTPNNNTRVVMDVQFLSTPSATSSLFGARASASSKNYSLLWASSKLRSDYNTQYSQTWSVAATNRRVIDKNKETTTIDGTSQSYTNASFQAPCTLTLLASNNNGTVQWKSSVKLYSCQIYDNGILVRDFVPCLSDADGIGLYDMVEGKFYGNAGTGAFTGSEVA